MLGVVPTQSPRTPSARTTRAITANGPPPLPPPPFCSSGERQAGRPCGERAVGGSCRSRARLLGGLLARQALHCAAPGLTCICVFTRSVGFEMPAARAAGGRPVGAWPPAAAALLAPARPAAPNSSRSQLAAQGQQRARAPAANAPLSMPAATLDTRPSAPSSRFVGPYNPMRRPALAEAAQDAST